MEWLLSNWIWIAFGIGMIAMHMFGHGRHGGHGGHGSHNRHMQRDPQRTNETKEAPPSEHAHTDNTLPNAAISDDAASRGAPVPIGQNVLPIRKDGERHHHSG